MADRIAALNAQVTDILSQLKELKQRQAAAAAELGRTEHAHRQDLGRHVLGEVKSSQVEASRKAWSAAKADCIALDAAVAELETRFAAAQTAAEQAEAEHIQDQITAEIEGVQATMEAICDLEKQALALVPDVAARRTRILELGRRHAELTGDPGRRMPSLETIIRNCPDLQDPTRRHDLAWPAISAAEDWEAIFGAWSQLRSIQRRS